MYLTAQRMHKAVQAANESFDLELEARSYHGRGGYRGQPNRPCFGVVLNEGVNPFGVVAALLADIDDELEREEAVNTFGETNTDQLGRGEIIYWPRIAWEEPAPAAEDEDGDDSDPDFTWDQRLLR